MKFVNDTKNYDQHFLNDKEVITEFINIINILPSDEIVEIGPGTGVLTKIIAKTAKKLTCIEIDERLKPNLEKIAIKYPNIELIFDNVLDAYIPKCDKIITSLPYSIIEPFITKLLKCEFEELFMIVGNKYAESVINNDKSKLAMLTNSFFKIKKYKEILPSSFTPPPRVKSALIKLTPIEYGELTKENLLFRLMFNLRTKKIKNNLLETLIKYKYLNNIIITQNQGRELILNLKLPEHLLDKTFETLSNEELTLLLNKLVSI